MTKKIDILKQILLISTGEYYEINLTKDLVPGIMYQVIDGKKYNINEKLGLKENARFSDIIDRWGKRVPENEKERFFEFFDISNILSNYNRGQDHLLFRYHTKNAVFMPMVAEQHIFMYTDEESGDVCAFTYVLDLTEKSNEEAYKKELEVKLAESSEKIDDDKKYLDVLYRNYILAYHLDVNDTNAEVLAVNQRAHVWSMPNMYLGAVFNFDEHIKEFEKRFIVEGNERFLKMLERSYIARRMRTTSRFSFRLECIPNISGNRYYDVQVVRVNKNFFDGRVIIFSEEIDDEIFAENRHRAQLNTERKYLETLAEDFVAVYHVRLNENISTLIKVDTSVDGYDEDRVSLRKTNNFVKRLEQYCKTYVAPEQSEKFKRQMMPENILKWLETDARKVYRYQIIQKDGKRKYFEVQVLKMDENSAAGDVLVAFRDIDNIVSAELRHQIEIEAQLEREISQNEVLTAIGNSFYTIFKIDLKKDTYDRLRMRDEVKHFYANHTSAFKELETVCNNFIAPEHRGKMHTFFDLTTLASRMKSKDDIEAECLTNDGDWWRVRFIAKRRDKAGNLKQVLYVTQRISDEKNREERLVSMAETANAANEAKTEFVSKVAHDIRTPMNSLFGFLQIAEANIDDAEKVCYCLKKIRVAVEFLKELVNDVLDISKMENGKMTLHPKEVSVAKLFDELPTSMQGSDFGKNIEFNCNIHDIFCDRVICDSLRLKQIYTNILSNAVKYTPNGGKIDFEVFEEETENADEIFLTVKVTDTGIGMSKSFMSKMFSKFERETDTRLNAVSGYGLGLSIVKQLTDIMGGTVDVQSEQGRGTSFTVKICLPRAVKDGENVNFQKDYAKMCEGMNLLVAEDNELSREVIEELLSMNGISCDIVSDGGECVISLENSGGKVYDAVLMDIQMPNVNGIDAAKRIRASKNAEIREIPIVAMTANVQSTDVQNCMNAGINKHLAKPIETKKLLKLLSELK